MAVCLKGEPKVSPWSVKRTYVTQVMKMKPIAISVILIVVLGLAVYGNSLDGKFIWDDIPVIKDNVYIRDFSHIKDIFTNDVGAGSATESGFYRPFYLVTYIINYSFSKLNVKSYHLTNIILHILAALAICWLVTILYGDWRLSLLTGVFFLVHPVHTEVVSYMSGRVDSLAALFTVLSLIFYIKNIHAKGAGFYILMLVCYVMALFSKENSLILPAAIILYHRSFPEVSTRRPAGGDGGRGKIRTGAFVSLIAVVFVYVVLRMSVLRSALLMMPRPSAVFQRLPGFFVAVFNYLKILLLPFDLHMEYGNIFFGFGDIKAISGGAMMLFLIIYAFSGKDKEPLIFFSVLWFFIMLLPVSNLYPVAFYMAEHYLYLPSVGFFLILAHSVIVLYRKKGYKTYAIIAALGLTGFYSYLTIEQNNYWKEPIYFYERTLKYVKNSSRVYNNLANCYSDIGKTDKAEALYGKAIEIDPENANTYNNLAIIYKNRGRLEEAIALYKKAIAIAPRHPDAYANLGIAFYSNGRVKEAIEAYSKVIEVNPNRADVFYNLGVAYSSMSRTEEAIDSYKKASAIDPHDPDTYINLGNSYKDRGKIKEAAASYKKAIELSPGNAAAYNNLRLLYYHEKE